MSEIITDAEIAALRAKVATADALQEEVIQILAVGYHEGEIYPALEKALRYYDAEPVAEPNFTGIPDSSIGVSQLVRNMKAIQEVLAMSDEDVREAGRKGQALGDDIPATPAPEGTAAPVGTCCWCSRTGNTPPAVGDDIPAPPEPDYLRHDSPEQHCWMDGWDIGYRAALGAADARLDDCVEQVDLVSDDIVTWCTRVMAVEQTTDALRRDVDALQQRLGAWIAGWDGQ